MAVVRHGVVAAGFEEVSIAQLLGRYLRVAKLLGSDADPGPGPGLLTATCKRHAVPILPALLPAGFFSPLSSSRRAEFASCSCSPYPISVPKLDKRDAALDIFLADKSGSSE